MSLRDQISSVKDYKLEPVKVPEWDTTVYLREITVAERSKLLAKFETPRTESDAYAHILLHSLCDENGTRVFSDDEFDTLASKNAKVIDRLSKQALKLNAINAEAVEDAKKN